MKTLLTIFLLCLTFCFNSQAQQICDVLTPPNNQRPMFLSTSPRPTGVYSKAVGEYIEADYTMYQHFNGDTAAERAWIIAMYAQKQKLYKADSMIIYIDSIGMWTTPDIYQNITSSSGRLIAFGSRMDSIKPTADLYHLLSFTPYNLGGVSYVGVLGINSMYKVSFSNIYTTYSNYPIYSWNVEVQSHESGHAIGSQHCHWCGWVHLDGHTGPIDTCWTPEGGCWTGDKFPLMNGTIMSYCHLNGMIDFLFGFGPLPRELMLQNIWNAYQLGVLKNPNWQPNTTPTCLPPSNVTISNITKTTANLSWNPAAGAYKYRINYRKSSETTWTKVDVMTNSFQLTNLTPNTLYKIQVRTKCGQTGSIWSVGSKSQSFKTLLP